MTSTKRIHLYIPYSILLLSLPFLLFLPGCAIQSHSTTEVIGTPPLPSEDPFAVAIPLSEYDQAPLSGELNGDDVAEKQGDLDENTSATPTKEGDTSTSSTNSGRTHHCYSCIGICTHEHGDERCKKEEDALCGWGASKDLRSAQLMAVEQCRGSLLKYTPLEKLPSDGATCSIPYCE